MSTVEKMPEESKERPSETLPIFGEYKERFDAVLADLVIPDPHAVPSFFSEVKDLTDRLAEERADGIAAEVVADLAKQEPMSIFPDDHEGFTEEEAAFVEKVRAPRRPRPRRKTTKEQ